MNCKRIEEQLIDYIDRNLDQETYHKIETHLKDCDSCSTALQKLTIIFSEIDNDPEELPNSRMKADFEDMIQKEKALLNESKVVSLHKNTKNSWTTAIQIAATIALIVSSFYYGKYQHDETASQKVAILKKEKVQLKQEITISMIENESASKRLKAVNYAEEFENPGDDILHALINKMHYDNHINVRLAAAEALIKFSNLEMVRKALVNALEMEKDPGMQIELIQILVSIQEKRAVPSMEKLLQNEETPGYVKDQVTIGLPTLI